MGEKNKQSEIGCPAHETPNGYLIQAATVELRGQRARRSKNSGKLSQAPDWACQITERAHQVSRRKIAKEEIKKTSTPTSKIHPQAVSQSNSSTNLRQSARFAERPLAYIHVSR